MEQNERTAQTLVLAWSAETERVLAARERRHAAESAAGARESRQPDRAEAKMEEII